MKDIGSQILFSDHNTWDSHQSTPSFIYKVISTHGIALQMSNTHMNIHLH